MPNLTIVLSEETSRRLRRAVKEIHGSRKGALSNLIEEAVNIYLDKLEEPKSPHAFRALREGRVIAEAKDLAELASKLRDLGVEPRNVRIVSTSGLRPVIEAGFRAKAI